MKDVDSAVSRDFCKDVMPLPQFEGTCWFNTMITALFYSDRTRGFFIDELPSIKKTLKDHPKILDMFEDLLFNNYRKNEKSNRNFYNALKPENMIKELNKSNKELFYIDEAWVKRRGWAWDGSFYMDQLFRFLNIKSKVLYLKMYNERAMSLSEKNANMRVTDDEAWMEYENYDDIENKKGNSYWRFITANPEYKGTQFSFELKKRKSTAVINRYIPGVIDLIPVSILVDSHAPEYLQFKNGLFQLDSMMLSNFNIKTCGAAHQICGITCKSKKYLYNGWMRNTNDVAMSSSKTQSSDPPKPCNIVRYEWSNTDDFCIDRINCTYPKPTSKNAVCFHARKGQRTYMYVRRSEPLETKSEVVNTDKECPSDQIMNPKSGRCVSRKGPTGIKLVLEERARREQKEKEDRAREEERRHQLKLQKEYEESMRMKRDTNNRKERGESSKKTCPSDQIMNPKSGRCVSRNGAIGKKLVLEERGESSKKTCPSDQIMNPKSGLCVSRNGAIGKKLVKERGESSMKTCPSDKIMNPKSGRCVSRNGAIGKKLVQQ